MHQSPSKYDEDSMQGLKTLQLILRTLWHIENILSPCMN